MTTNSQDNVLIAFGSSAQAFRPVDDRVMGGVSQSEMVPSAQGYAMFQGELSLENNGGFASVRSTGITLDLSKASGVMLRVRGDAKRYRLRLYDERSNGVAFQVVFETTAGEWVEKRFPLDEFKPVWRGRSVPDAAPLAREQVTTVGLMIADGQTGAFALEVDTLEAR